MDFALPDRLTWIQTDKIIEIYANVIIISFLFRWINTELLFLNTYFIEYIELQICKLLTCIGNFLLQYPTASFYFCEQCWWFSVNVIIYCPLYDINFLWWSVRPPGNWQRFSTSGSNRISVINGISIMNEMKVGWDYGVGSVNVQWIHTPAKLSNDSVINPPAVIWLLRWARCIIKINACRTLWFRRFCQLFSYAASATAELYSTKPNSISSYFFLEH